MKEKLKQLIEAETGADAGAITAEAKLADLVADSLEFMDLILRVQTDFHCEISDAIVAQIETVADLEKAIAGELAA